MSLEQKLDELNESVVKLIATLSGAKVSKASASDADDGEDEVADKPKRGRPAKKTTKTTTKRTTKKAPPAEEEEEFEEEEEEEFEEEEEEELEEEDVTADTIRELLHAVKEAKGAPAARDILSKVGAKTIATVPPDKYSKVIALVKKAGVKA